MRQTPGLDRFMTAYEPALVQAARDGKYYWPSENAPIVAEKMRRAFATGMYNHGGPAIRAACKALGIKHTRTAIEAFLTGDPQ